MSPARVTADHNPLRADDDKRLPRIAGPSALVLFGVTGDLARKKLLPAIYDLNAALLSYALSGYDGWLSSAGYIGPKVQVAHDISLLVPEVFSRMTEAERAAIDADNARLAQIEVKRGIFPFGGACQRWVAAS